MARNTDKIRLQNLELLITEAGSATKLARLADTSSSYLSQVRRKMRTSKGTPRNIGDDLAEKLERGMGKPEGWMDIPHVTAWGASLASPGDNNTTPRPNIHSLHPLISWVQAGEWSEIAEGYVPPYGEELFPCPVHCSKETFVLRIRGASMEPKFRDGELIFVDPNVEAIHGKYVVVRLNDSNEATFKQLIIEDERQYLKALNPNWPTPIIEIKADATICGVAVFKGEMV
jgi:SOS-response transcriptional repressor LexA